MRLLPVHNLAISLRNQQQGIDSKSNIAEVLGVDCPSLGYSVLEYHSIHIGEHHKHIFSSAL